MVLLNFLFLSSNEAITIIATHKKNTTAILSINGKFGAMNFMLAEKTNVPRAANKAPFAVALFQKKPSKKMANAPGLIKPVNS